MKKRNRKQRLIKGRGRFFILWAAAALSAALASGKVEYYIIGGILSAILLTGLLQVVLQKPRLKLQAGSGQVLRGQETNISLLVVNPRPWPLFPLRLALSLSLQGQNSAVFTWQDILIPPKGEKLLQATVICPHCGEYRLELEPHYAEDIFGLFALACPTPKPQLLLSLPLLTPGKAEDFRHISPEEENRQGRNGLQGQLIAESRLYRQGDTLSSIHWKKSVGRRLLFSRLREYTAGYSCHILIDTQPWGEGEAALDYQDNLREAALSLIFAQVKQNRSVTLLPAQFSLNSPAGLDKAGAILAALPFEEGATLAALNRLRQNPVLPDTLLILQRHPCPQLEECLQELLSQGCNLICLEV